MERTGEVDGQRRDKGEQTEDLVDWPEDHGAEAADPPQGSIWEIYK